MYMETPVAVAEMDEGGMLRVHAAIQGIDKCQSAMSRIMGLPYNHVHIGAHLLPPCQASFQDSVLR